VVLNADGYLTCYIANRVVFLVYRFETGIVPEVIERQTIKFYIYIYIYIYISLISVELRK
jgi:hypothetical protein